MKEPSPVPSTVLKLLVVGPGDVCQQIPRAVTGFPPSETTVVLTVADVEVIVCAADVADNTGKTAGFTGVESVPDLLQPLIIKKRLKIVTTNLIFIKAKDISSGSKS
ncbi:MAG: hypothetical protein IPL50_10500 [Chitinophagaceae bacterium]|nr:hypothetical protein [Chitinophagaceae bacterium]